MGFARRRRGGRTPPALRAPGRGRPPPPRIPPPKRPPPGTPPPPAPPRNSRTRAPKSPSRAAGLPCVVERRRLEGHQARRLELHPAARERVLHRLVLPDRAVEDDALVRVRARARERGAAQADGFGGDEDPLGVHAVQNVIEP